MTANTLIFSCDTTEALYGTISKLEINVIKVHCNTTFAAPIRPAGMDMCVFKNQTPTDSANTNTMTDKESIRKNEAE